MTEIITFNVDLYFFGNFWNIGNNSYIIFKGIFSVDYIFRKLLEYDTNSYIITKINIQI